jgi:hypothetical protein
MDGVLGAAASSKSGGEIGGQLSQLPGPIAGALGAAWVGLVAAAPALLRCRLFGRNDRQQEMGLPSGAEMQAGDAAEDVHGTIARLAVRPRVPDWRISLTSIGTQKLSNFLAQN